MLPSYLPSFWPNMISHTAGPSALEFQMIIYSSHKATWTMLAIEGALCAFLKSACFSAQCFGVSPPSLNDKVNPPGSPLWEPPARPLPLTPELQDRPTKGPICTVWGHNAVISVRSSRRSEGESHPPAQGQCRPVGWARGLWVLVIPLFFHYFLLWKSHLIHSFIIKHLCFFQK